MSEHEELRTLIAAVSDESITPEGRHRLGEILKHDAAAREAYLASATIDAMLHWDCGAAWSGGAAPAPRPARTTAWRVATLLRWPLAAALVISLIAAMILLDRPSSRSFASEGGPVAVITDTHDAQWIGTEMPTRIGSALRPGWLKLRSGSATIELLGGASFIVQGPAEIGLNSPRRVFLRHGKLTAYLEASDGVLTVATDAAVIASRGPHFGVNVHPDGRGEAHALSGGLYLYQPQGADPARPLALAEGYAARFSLADAMQHTAADASAFARVDELTVPEPPATAAVLKFTPANIQPYSFQDGQHKLPTGHEILEDGRALRLTGNAWKRIEIDALITRDTVIELEFRSTMLGQIHAFGFDTDDHYRSDDQPMFQLYGYEALPNIGQQFNNYAGEGWQRYRIRVGRYLAPGKQRYIYFTADDDVTAAAESVFRNVRIYETPSDR